MSAEYPEQRRISARIHTSAGWLTGTFHVAAALGFLDHLRTTGDFFSLTAVLLPGHRSPLEFFALQHRATVLVVPTETEADVKLIADAADAKPHSVACLLEHGVLNGTLALPPTVRVSDYLLEQKGFFVVRNCTLGTQHPSQESVSVEMLPLVLVNAACVIGIAEMPAG